MDDPHLFFWGKEMSEPWYAVKMLYKCEISGESTSNSQDNTTTYEESIRLVRASSFDDAYERVAKFVSENELEYENQYGQKVAWTFFDFIDCFHLFDEEIDEGVEVYSKHWDVPKHISDSKIIKYLYPEIEDV